VHPCFRGTTGGRRDRAAIASMDPARVWVKATTAEGLGFAGRGEGVACLATATLRLSWDGLPNFCRRRFNLSNGLEPRLSPPLVGGLGKCGHRERA
jgi:hypothetical protein